MGSGTQEPDDTRPHYHSHALSRGLAIMREVATTSGLSTLADLHERTGYPKSTLVRLLAVLDEEDYLIKVDERPAYRLGHGLLPIAAGYMASGPATELVRPILARLAVDSGWTSNFAILEGTDVLHLCVEFPNRPIHYTTGEGSRSAAYCTGLGKAIMSALPADEAESAMPAEPFPTLTPHTITTRDAMRSELARTRERGYAVDAEEADLGLRCLAAPITAKHGVLGAVSVSGPSGEADPEREAEYVSMLYTARDEILAIRELVTALGLARGASSRVES